jgi:mRNA-degrading endonuclease RelE of RelBE toxin-antitoxin system
MWRVGFANKAAKQMGKLPKDVQTVVAALVAELEVTGPMLFEWKHFSKLKNQGERFHCHIKSGRPTYVACWEVIDKRIRILEVYYVGTHENAPY